MEGFAKAKLDERVVKILATVNVGGELEQLAMRGARYGAAARCVVAAGAAKS